MKIFFYYLVILCFVNLTGCLPSSLQTEVLRPKSEKGKVYNFKEVLAFDNKKVDDPFIENIAVIGIDSMMIFFVLWEMEDIYLLDVYFMNNSIHNKTMNLNYYNLFAGNFALKRLLPDKAANLFLKKTTNMHPYRPKLKYEVETSTKGRIDSYGNYTEKSKSKITTKEDGLYQLGYAIGSFINDYKNLKYEEMATTIYNDGFIEDIEISHEAITYGSMFWNKNVSLYPIKLRFEGTDIEIEFSPNK